MWPGSSSRKLHLSSRVAVGGLLVISCGRVCICQRRLWPGWPLYWSSPPCSYCDKPEGTQTHPALVTLFLLAGSLSVGWGYLLHCFADNLLVLLLSDFLLLVKWFDGCFNFIYSFLLELLFLGKKETIWHKVPKRPSHQAAGMIGTFSFLELSAWAVLCRLGWVVEDGSAWLGTGWPTLPLAGLTRRADLP